MRLLIIKKDSKAVTGGFLNAPTDIRRTHGKAGSATRDLIVDRTKDQNLVLLDSGEIPFRRLVPPAQDSTGHKR